MTARETAVLDPYAQAIETLTGLWAGASAAQRLELMAAAEKATPTNCWFATYRAAQWILGQKAA